LPDLGVSLNLNAVISGSCEIFGYIIARNFYF
jgi:hypothetical protein